MSFTRQGFFRLDRSTGHEPWADREFPSNRWRMFGEVPMNLELRLSVEDSPNSAGVAIDMIRCAKLAKDRGLGGPILAPSSYFCKHPPEQVTDDEAYEAVERFIRGDRLN